MEEEEKKVPNHLLPFSSSAQGVRLVRLLMQLSCPESDVWSSYDQCGADHKLSISPTWADGSLEGRNNNFILLITIGNFKCTDELRVAPCVTDDVKLYSV